VYPELHDAETATAATRLSTLSWHRIDNLTSIDSPRGQRAIYNVALFERYPGTPSMIRWLRHLLCALWTHSC
jgi:hypothetical protein